MRVVGHVLRPEVQRQLLGQGQDSRHGRQRHHQIERPAGYLGSKLGLRGDGGLPEGGGVFPLGGRSCVLYGQVQQPNQHLCHVHILLPQLETTPHELDSRAPQDAAQARPIGRLLEDDRLENFGGLPGHHGVHRLHVRPPLGVVA